MSAGHFLDAVHIEEVFDHAGRQTSAQTAAMPPKGSKAAAKDAAGEGPSKKQKTGDKATKAETANKCEVISAQDALPATRVKLYNGGQGILLGFRVPKDYFLATGAGDTNEASLLSSSLACLLYTLLHSAASSACSRQRFYTPKG